MKINLFTLYYETPAKKTSKMAYFSAKGNTDLVVAHETIQPFSLFRSLRELFYLWKSIEWKDFDP